MPIKAVVSPKFTYSQGAQYINIYYAGSGNAKANGMFDYTTAGEYLHTCVAMPVINFPKPGNGHSARKSNRITVTSIRLKMHFVMDHPLMYSNAMTNSYNYAAQYNIPINPCMFAKFRLFLISVDDDITVTREKLLNWFYSTHCMYRDPTEAEVLKGPKETDLTTSPAPTSVHSNILRVTTDWTGKFNILADRKFTVRPRHPNFDIDMTIPLRKEYVFDEQYTEDSELLYPKLYCFILPPLSYEVDVDNLSGREFANKSSGSFLRIFRMYYWAKLNFVDL